MKKDYRKSLDTILMPLQSQMYDLKVNAMTQRTILIDFFEYYCDALFYDRFQECNHDFVPNLTTNFKSILDKLSDIEWDTVAGVSNTAFAFKDNIYVNDSSAIELLKSDG